MASYLTESERKQESKGLQPEWAFKNHLRQSRCFKKKHHGFFVSEFFHSLLALEGGVPAAKLVVGTPFFSKELGGERRAVSYKKIADEDAVALPESTEGFTPVGPEAIDPRIRAITKSGLGGAMVWDYGHDSMDPEQSMLRQLSRKLESIP